MKLLFILFSISAFAASAFAVEQDFEPRIESESVHSDISQDHEDILSRFNANYFGILYGPSVKKPTSYQPDFNGEPNIDRPVFLKNFLSVGYNISPEYSVAATGYWLWQPVQGQKMVLQDPFVRVSDNFLIHSGNLNLYSDVRFHFPVTSYSHFSDLLFGAQTFQSLTYEVPSSRILLGLYGSLRGNWYGKYGFGNNLELYLAPNLNYQFSPTMAFTFLYEIQLSHLYGEKFHSFHNDGTDIEPGISWQATPSLLFNPYLNILIGDGSLSLSSTSLGLLVSWMLM